MIQNKLILLTLGLGGHHPVCKQKTIDRIVGQVGDKIILQSEVESIYCRRLPMVKWQTICAVTSSRTGDPETAAHPG